MHPMFVKLFIEADADDLLAEEEVELRRARRSQRNRPAVVVRDASRHRNLRPQRADRPSACPRLPGKHGIVPGAADEGDPADQQRQNRKRVRQ
jgi:hypothetical protein